MIFQLQGTPPDTPFPIAELATQEPDGLLAVGGDLSRPRLLQAYSQGIFPWYSEGQPILWWSPDPRAVLYPRDIHVSRSLRRRLRKGGLFVKIDTRFDAVLEACAARGWTARIADEPLYSDDLGVEPPVDTFLGAFRANVEVISNALGTS